MLILTLILSINGMKQEAVGDMKYLEPPKQVNFSISISNHNTCKMKLKWKKERSKDISYYQIRVIQKTPIKGIKISGKYYYAYSNTYKIKINPIYDYKVKIRAVSYIDHKRVCGEWSRWRKYKHIDPEGVI